MKSKNDRSPKRASPKNDPRSGRKRFLIEKLEERIAPKKGGNGTHNCSSSIGSSAGDSNPILSNY